MCSVGIKLEFQNVVQRGSILESQASFQTNLQGIFHKNLLLYTFHFIIIYMFFMTLFLIYQESIQIGSKNTERLEICFVAFFSREIR